MAEQAQGFWSTLPGILTGIAAVITAGTGLYIAISNNQPDSRASNANVSQPAVQQPIPEPSIPSPQKVPNTVTEPNVAVTSSTGTESVKRQIKPFPNNGPLVDCSLFPSVNTSASLMSWSNYYHKQIIAAEGVKRRLLDPCNKTIDYRGMAHCQAPDNDEVRQAFIETLQLCRMAGIEWQDIQHTRLIGK